MVQKPNKMPLQQIGYYLQKSLADLDLTLTSARGTLDNASATLTSANLKAKKILADKDRLIEERGPLMRCLECVAQATPSGTGGPRDEVEGRAVGPGGQAGSCD